MNIQGISNLSKSSFGKQTISYTKGESTKMKSMKAVFSVLISLLLAVSLTIPAFAAGTKGDLVIQNSSSEVTYKIYKIFDAQISADKKSVVYTTGTAFASGDSYFSSKKIGTNLYSVTPKFSGDLTDDIIDYLKTNYVKATNLKATKAGNGKAVTISDLDYGYYYVKRDSSTAETVDSIVTIKDDTNTIYDKNPSTPGPGNDPETGDPGSEYKYVKDGSNYATEASFSVGTKQEFHVTIKAVNYVTDGTTDDAKQVEKYIIKDTPSGIKIDYTTDFAVSVGGTKLTKDTDYTVDTTNHVITITWAKQNVTTPTVYDSPYSSPSNIDITYKAEILNAGTSTNTVDLYYTTVGSTTEIKVPKSGPDVTVKNYNLTVNNWLVGTPDTALAGAKYEVKVGGETVKFVKDGDDYRVATQEEIAAGTGILTELADTTGSILLKGLGTGTYTIDQVEPTSGYKALDEQTYTITTTSENVVNFKNDTTNYLPGTGSVGTTIFVTLGSALILIAGLFLFANAKMKKETA